MSNFFCILLLTQSPSLLISLEKISNRYVAIKIIDPPTSALDHYSFQQLIVDVVPNFSSTPNTKQVEHEKVAHQ
jgi:hypothetical protein